MALKGFQWCNIVLNSYNHRLSWIRSGKTDHKKALEHYNQAADAVITTKLLLSFFYFLFVSLSLYLPVVVHLCAN